MTVFSELRNTPISVIVPVFNEVQSIIGNMNLLFQELEANFDHFEVIVVLDGSTDGTRDLLQLYQHENLRKIFIETNRGKGFAIRSGLQATTKPYVFFIDGGMELHPRDLKFFLGLLLLYQADSVIGSKRHPQSEIYYPIYRRFLSAVFQQFVKLLFGLKITDSQVGIKLYRREVLEAIQNQLELDRYGFDLEFLVLAKIHGYSKVIEAPIRLDYFEKLNRNTLGDLLHVFRVGMVVLTETIRLKKKIDRIKRE